jgi:hypothetical protein
MAKKVKKAGKQKNRAGSRVPRDITVSAPVSKQTTYNARAPFMRGEGKGFVIRHREWLQQIVSVQAFTGAGRYIIQPGLPDNFPWLAQMAANFENYRFRAIRYVYRNHVATSANFSIYMGVQYDVSDPEFKSVEEIMNYVGSREEVCYRNFLYDIRPNRGRLSRKYMVRTDILPSGLDPTLYDTALFTICGVGSGAAGTYLGDLSVEYEVEFTNPKMNPNSLGAIGVWSIASAPNLSSFTAAPLAGQVFSESKAYGMNGDNMPIVNSADVSVGGAHGTIQFPVPGAYSVRYSVSDPGSTATINPSAGWQADANTTIVDGVQSYSSAAGKGFVNFCDVITTTPGGKIGLGILSGSGTAGAAISSTLSVTCESLNYMLNYFSEDPNPPLASKSSVNRLQKLIQVYGKKHDVSKLRDRLKKIEQREEVEHVLDDYVSLRCFRSKFEEKEELPAPKISRPLEVDPDRVENSDSDEVVVPRSKSVDKRSKSSERKDREQR